MERNVVEFIDFLDSIAGVPEILAMIFAWTIGGWIAFNRNFYMQ